MQPIPLRKRQERRRRDHFLVSVLGLEQLVILRQWHRVIRIEAPAALTPDARQEIHRPRPLQELLRGPRTSSTDGRRISKHIFRRRIAIDRIVNTGENAAPRQSSATILSTELVVPVARKQII